MSSLIPERPLLISPTLAATIGLEEAVLLHVLSELLLQQPAQYRRQRRFGELSQDGLQRALPFWTLPDIKRIQRNLQEQGLIVVEPGATPGSQQIAINQQVAVPSDSAPARERARAPSPFRAAQSAGKASYLPPNWQPAEDLYRQCQLQGIPRDFAEQRVKGFVMYQRERGKTQYSWNNTFLKYILKEWRNEQSYRGARELESDMSPDWRPSEDAIAILEHGGVNRAFIEDSVAEFVLYWRERGLVTSTWNSRFLQHVRLQWAKFQGTVEHDSTPRPIPVDYQPSPLCYEVLAMARIDEDFARAQLKEFVLYWKDRGEACASWNTRFLQHVKYKWATRPQSALPAARQLENTLERLTDRSWAE